MGKVNYLKRWVGQELDDDAIRKMMYLEGDLGMQGVNCPVFSCKYEGGDNG